MRRSYVENIISSGSRDLILLNPHALSKDWAGKRQKLIQSVKSARDRQTGFTNEGEMLYQTWLHQSFPERLSELRHLTERVNSLGMLIDAIRYETTWTAQKKWEAYRAVMERHSRNGPLVSEAAMEAEAEFFAERERLQSEAREKLTEKYGESIFSGEDFSGEERIQPDNEIGDFSAPPNEHETQLKTYYRELARSLHPDVIGTPTPNQKHLWNEVQNAYDQKDLGRLLVLRTSINKEAEAIPEKPEDRLAQLIAEVFQLRATLKGFRAEERRLAKDPAFLYFKCRYSETKRLVFGRKIEAGLKYQIHSLEEMIRENEAILAALAKVPKARKKAE